MTDGVTFEDMLSHYEGKLREAADGLENIRRSLKEVFSETEDFWSGKAADAFRQKTEEINALAAKAENAVSDARIKLSETGELLLSEEI